VISIWFILLFDCDTICESFPCKLSSGFRFVRCECIYDGIGDSTLVSRSPFGTRIELEMKKGYVGNIHGGCSLIS